MTSHIGPAILLAVTATALGIGSVAAQSTRPGGSIGPDTIDPIPSAEELASWMAEEGGLERVQEGIRARISVVRGGEGTIWVQLLSVIGQVDATVAPMAIWAVGMGVEADGLSGAELIMEGINGVAQADRPPLLALAALLSATEDARRAAEIRGCLLQEHPEAPEATEVRLVQAAWLLGEGDMREEGMRLLEDLIVDSPQHPLAPEARRLYQANGGRGAVDPTGGAP